MADVSLDLIGLECLSSNIVLEPACRSLSLGTCVLQRYGLFCWLDCNPSNLNPTLFPYHPRTLMKNCQGVGGGPGKTFVGHVVHKFDDKLKLSIVRRECFATPI